MKLHISRKIKSVHSHHANPGLSNVPPTLVACPPLEDSCGISLCEILREECVKLNLAAGTKDEAVAELVDLLVQTNDVKNRESAVVAVTQRERLGSTALGNGVALPHGIDCYSDRIAAALGVSRGGLDFGAEDGKPTHVIFMLLGHANCLQSNLHALEQAAKLLQAPEILDVALEAGSPADMLRFIRSGTWAQW